MFNLFPPMHGINEMLEELRERIGEPPPLFCRSEPAAPPSEMPQVERKRHRRRASMPPRLVRCHKRQKGIVLCGLR